VAERECEFNIFAQFGLRSFQKWDLEMSHDNWARSLGLAGDGSLFVEVENGLRLYDLCLNERLPGAIDIHPEVLMRPENRHLYRCFLRTLKEIEGVVIHSMYDAHYSVQKGDVVVDAGARIGAFAAKISAAVGDEGRVIAIEPEPRSHACLLKNIEFNRLRNVTAVPKMLWSRTRSLDLHLSGNLVSHSAYCDAFYGSTGESLNVEAETLDNILQELGIDSVDFVKMDIEGAEIEALKGMKEILKSNVQLAIAAYHPVNGTLTNAVLVDQLEKLGFEAVYEDGIVRAQKEV
jgi:FkbM family methyltransferase